MTIDELVELEARLKDFIAHGDSAGIRATVISLCHELDIPCPGDPTLVVRDESANALITRCADLLFAVRQPQPEDLCAELLICAAVQLVTSSNSARFGAIVRRALTLAEASGSKRTIRRALNNCAVAAIHGGDPTLGLTLASRAYVLARELNDISAEIGALCNAGAALQRLELHFECISINLPAPPADSAAAATALHAMAGHYVNKATSHLALGECAKATEAAHHALHLIRGRSTPVTVWYAVTAQQILLRSAIRAGERATVIKTMQDIEATLHGHRSRRVDIIYGHACAAYESYLGHYDAALPRLLLLRDETLSLPTLHHDTLVALHETYKASGDHSSALACLADIVKYLGAQQVARVAALLADLGGALKTVSSVHNTAAALLSSVSSRSTQTKTPELPRKSTAAMQETFERLAVAGELNEDDSGRHIYRVGRLTGLLAAEVGLDAAACEALELAARLHDIGKLGLPGALLARAEALSAGEHKVMREHVDIGRKILQQANDPAFDVACDIAYSHHERWDGSGYPQRLSGAAIPEAARMVALTEAFDVLMHGRAYQRAVTVPEALTRLQQGTGTHFEPRLVVALVTVVHRLHAQHGNDDAALSEYLGSGATASSFLQARDSMHELLGSLSPAKSAATMQTKPPAAVPPVEAAVALRSQPRARSAPPAVAAPRSPNR